MQFSRAMILKAFGQTLVPTLLQAHLPGDAGSARASGDIWLAEAQLSLVEADQLASLASVKASFNRRGKNEASSPTPPCLLDLHGETSKGASPLTRSVYLSVGIGTNSIRAPATRFSLAIGESGENTSKWAGHFEFLSEETLRKPTFPSQSPSHPAPVSSQQVSRSESLGRRHLDYIEKAFLKILYDEMQFEVTSEFGHVFQRLVTNMAQQLNSGNTDKLLTSLSEAYEKREYSKMLKVIHEKALLFRRLCKNLVKDVTKTPPNLDNLEDQDKVAILTYLSESYQEFFVVHCPSNPEKLQRALQTWQAALFRRSYLQVLQITSRSCQSEFDYTDSQASSAAKVVRWLSEHSSYATDVDIDPQDISTALVQLCNKFIRKLIKSFPAPLTDVHPRDFHITENLNESLGEVVNQAWSWHQLPRQLIEKLEDLKSKSTYTLEPQFQKVCKEHGLRVLVAFCRSQGDPASQVGTLAAIPEKARDRIQQLNVFSGDRKYSDFLSIVGLNRILQSFEHTLLKVLDERCIEEERMVHNHYIKVYDIPNSNDCVFEEISTKEALEYEQQELNFCNKNYLTRLKNFEGATRPETLKRFKERGWFRAAFEERIVNLWEELQYQLLVQAAHQLRFPSNPLLTLKIGYLMHFNERFPTFLENGGIEKGMMKDYAKDPGYHRCLAALQSKLGLKPLSWRSKLLQLSDHELYMKPFSPTPSDVKTWQLYELKHDRMVWLNGLIQASLTDFKNLPMDKSSVKKWLNENLQTPMDLKSNKPLKAFPVEDAWFSIHLGKGIHFQTKLEQQSYGNQKFLEHLDRIASHFDIFRLKLAQKCIEASKKEKGKAIRPNQVKRPSRFWIESSPKD